MAADETLVVWTPQAAEPPASNPANFDTRNQHPVLDFDASQVEGIWFSGVMPSNKTGTNGLKVILSYAMSTSGSGDVRWRIAVERTTQLTSASFGPTVTVSSTVPSTSGNIGTATIDLSAAQIDGITPGDVFRLQVERVANDLSDTAAGDAELRGVEIRDR